MKKLPHLCAALLLTAVVLSLQTKSPAPRTADGPEGSRQVPSTRSTTPGDAAASDSAASPRRAWGEPASVTGVPLLMTAGAKTSGTSAPRTGRQAVVSVDGAASLSTWETGDRIQLPLPDGRTAEGTVHYSETDAPWHRVAGSLKAGEFRGSFSLRAAAGDAGPAGQILFRLHPVAVRIEAEGANRVRLTEVPKASIICSNPVAEASQALALAAAAAPANESAGPVAAQPPSQRTTPVPVFNSRPGARVVLYMDFDGEFVMDPDWNGGRPVNAAAAPLSDADIEQVFLRVKDDFRPFDINVTTDVIRYNSAPVRSRMRCIVTPTNNWEPSSAGIGFLYSFAGAGSGYSRTIPCWAFTFTGGSLEYLAGTISHEFGHTLGLNHDGFQPYAPPDSYYEGHGSGPTAWGPIMGSHTNPVSQWSKGEYTGANNREDDLAIITSADNRISYAQDDAGNSQATAAEMPRNGAVLKVFGTIERNTDVDVFRLSSLAAGPLLIEAIPDGVCPGLDLAIELYRDTTRVAVSTLTGSLEARLYVNITAPGTYYLHVRGAGEGSVSGTGYSNYASLGDYRIEGWHDSPPPPPPVSETITDSEGKPAFQVQSFKWDGRYAVLQFPTVSGRNYRLMKSTDLVEWTPAADFVRGTGQSVVVVGSIREESPRVFFRVNDVAAPQAPQAPVILYP